MTCEVPQVFSCQGCPGLFLGPDRQSPTCSQPVGDGQCRVIDTAPRWSLASPRINTAPAFPFRVFYSFQADESAIGLPGTQNHIEMFLAVRGANLPCLRVDAENC